MADIAEKLEQIVKARLEADKLELPAPPDTAMAALNLLKNPDVSGKELVRVLERDPVLIAVLIKLASVAKYGGVPVKNVEGAISRLGMKNLKSAIMEASAHKLYHSRDPRIAASMKTILQHALATAVLGRDFAAIVGTADQETVYLAGLLHDVGKAVIGGYLLEAEKSMGSRRGWIDAKSWVEAVRRSHRSVGVALATKWQFPDAVVAAVSECSEFDAANRAAPANFVCFANALVKSQGIYEAEFDEQDNAAIIMVGRSILGVDDDLIQRLTNDLAGRVSAMMS